MTAREIPRFTRLRSPMVPLLIDDVDTDQIIPADFLKGTDRGDLGEGLFARWRRQPDFVLNSVPDTAPGPSESSSVLLAGENFGCGSSREHAAWALLDYGFRAVLSPRFADIFRLNALRNGLLAVTVDHGFHRRLIGAVERDPGALVTIDLERSRLTAPDGSETALEIEPFARRCLLEGIDQLGYLLRQCREIDTYEARRPPRFDTRRPDGAPNHIVPETAQ